MASPYATAGTQQSGVVGGAYSPASSVESFEAPSLPPWRSETNHLTPNHRPRSRSPLRDSHSPYQTFTSKEQWTSQDPRSSSMQSLRPVESAGRSRRTLLLVYIHGFMGNERSFKSFPAHVHNVLTVTLAETHVVHSKIYPQYRSRRPIEHAAEDFSNWVTPHESPDTDIVLLGHSLGGILAAEVALIRAHSPKSSEVRRHGIVGLIAFDTPYLGMHPGVIGTGLSSIFRSKSETVEKPDTADSSTVNSKQSIVSSAASITSSISALSEIPSDPNFNPAFQNDAKISQRKGLEKALYFINKHSDGLTRATGDYMKSHLEFGGCMADYPGLKRRYNAIRALEDIDELSGHRDAQGRSPRRVRFVNYYSASTGRIKPSKSPPKSPTSDTAKEMQDMTLRPDSYFDGARRSGSVTPTTPRMSLEEVRPDGLVVAKTLEAMDRPDEDVADAPTESMPEATTTLTKIESAQDSGETKDELAIVDSKDETKDGLPPLPPEPTPPPNFDASLYTDPDHLKLAQKDHARLIKAHDRAKKDRDKSIRERDKVIQKREKAAKKHADKLAKTAAANHSIEQRELLKRSTTLNPETYDRQLAKDAEDRRNGTSSEAEIQKIKKQRDRKFCALPAKDQRTGLRDQTWIRVYMEGIDEVEAHTSMFIPEGETYERLVGDTADRVERWVNEERGLRVALEEGG